MNTQFPSFSEAFRVWLRIGCLSFGGPAGQIALMHREVVDERRWVSDTRFLHALNFCTLLPGPGKDASYIFFLQACMPSAVALVSMADNFGGNIDFISASLFQQHLIGFITIPVFIGFFRYYTG